eukprot:UC1_evm4s372
MARWFRQPTFCSLCHQFIWGVVSRQGYQCVTCGKCVHKHCHEKVIDRCPGAEELDKTIRARNEALQQRFNVNIPHKFKGKTFKSPTFCSHCGTLLWGLYKQGVACEICHTSCHKRCADKMANLCGLDAAKLVHELDMIGTTAEAMMGNKKGGSNTVYEDKAAAAAAAAPKSKKEIAAAKKQAAKDAKQAAKNAKQAAKEQAKLGMPSAKDFSWLKVLGKGSFGKVMLAEHKKTKEIFAIKLLKKDVLIEDDDVACALAEKRVLAIACQHPFLTALHSTFQTPDRLFYVMEFVNGGDLLFQIQASGRFKEPRARFYAGEIVCALLFLHKRNICYRDLKLDNVMLDWEGHIKVADFGMCKEDYDKELCTTFCGTPDYIAPEIIREDPYGPSVDWWALGVLLYEMMAGQPPFAAETEDELFPAILTDEVLYPSWMSRDAVGVIRGFLIKDPSGRLGCAPGGKGEADIKGHPFFKSLDWAKLERREIKPPFKPPVKNRRDFSQFDIDFLSEKPGITPCPRDRLNAIPQEEFMGFEFVNPDFA